MPPNDGNTLGSANVRIAGDTSGLDAAVDHAKDKVREIGPAAGDAKSQADALFQSMVNEGNRAADAAEKVERNVGKINAGLSLLASVGATAAVAAVGLLVRWWQNAEEAADKAREAFRKAYEASEKSRLAAQDALENFSSPASAMAREIEAANRITDKAIADQTEQLRKAGKQSEVTYKAITERIEVLEEQRQNAIADIQTRYTDKAARAAQEAKEKQLEKEKKEEEKAQDQIVKDRIRTYQVLMEMQDAMIAQVEKERQAIERVNQTRLQGYVDQERALQRLYDAQSRGFSGEGANNSLEGAINALEITIRGMAARSGGGI